MKRITIFIAALASCLVMSAQDVKVKSRVELKGGKADVVGYAELQSDGGYVVETESGDVFYYSPAEIKKVTQLEVDRVETVKVKKANGDRSKTKGYMGIVEAGLGYYKVDTNFSVLGADPYSDSEGAIGGSLSVINGYRFSPHFYVGLGIGFDVDYYRGIDFPVFLHLRTEFTKKRISPYLAFSGGFLIPFNYDSGFYLEGAFGIRSHCKKHGSMWYGLTASILQGSYSYNDGYEHGNDSVSAIKFKIAYSF